MKPLNPTYEELRGCDVNIMKHSGFTIGCGSPHLKNNYTISRIMEYGNTTDNTLSRHGEGEGRVRLLALLAVSPGVAHRSSPRMGEGRGKHSCRLGRAQRSEGRNTLPNSNNPPVILISKGSRHTSHDQPCNSWGRSPITSNPV